MMLVAVVVSVVALSSLSAVSGLADDSTYYVFAYSWTPEFCYGQPTYAGCKNPQAFWGTYFTLHGLWPQYSNGGYPATCTTEAFNSSIPTSIGWNDMTQYWPNVQYLETDSSYDSFWEHEWTKHGTCSGLTQQDYFQNTLNLIKSFGTPKSVTAAVGGTISAASLRSDFGGAEYVSLQCTSGKFLNGAYTCWSKVNNLPTAQIVCGADVQKEDTCTASTLTVTSF